MAVAMNGQDYNDIKSYAEVTFVGTGTDTKIFMFIIGTLLIALLLLGLFSLCFALYQFVTLKRNKPSKHRPYTINIRDTQGSGSRANVAFGRSSAAQSRAYSRAM